MIQSEPEDIEQIRARIRKMSDRELRQYGRAAAHMADPRKNHGNPNVSAGAKIPIVPVEKSPPLAW